VCNLREKVILIWMLNLIFLNCITKLCSSRFLWIATLNWENLSQWAFTRRLRVRDDLHRYGQKI